jgi:hypothetical protein
MEAFELRLKNPTNYILFYDNFLRAVEGEARWKASATSGNDLMTSSYNEAFAMILLKNNYAAWLAHEMGDKYPNLMTDYDETIPDNAKTLAEYVVKGVCSFVQGEDDDDDDTTFITTYRPKEGTAGAVDELRRYNEELKLYRDITEKAREEARLSEDCPSIREAKRKIIDSKTNDDDAIYKQKRRKILKGLKEYTGTRSAGEKAYRGWSTRAHTQMLKFKREIDIDIQLKTYERFNAEYKNVYATRKANRASLLKRVEETTNRPEERVFDELFQLPTVWNM